MSIVYNNVVDKEVVSFINKNRICVLTVLLPTGTPHSASMHFASNDTTFVFFTKLESKKAKDLEYGKEYKATVVTGFDDNKMITFQSEGIVEKIDKTKSKPEEELFANKFYGAKLKDDHVVLKYTAKWWRYTEFKPKFKVIYSEK